MKRILPLLALFALAAPVHAKQVDQTAVMAARAPLSFIENKGQITDQFRSPRPDIGFSIKTGGGLSIFVGSGAIHYQFSATQHSDVQPRPALRHKHPELPTRADMYRMDVTLLGANRNAQVITAEPAPYTENYFTAATAGKCVTAHSCNRITYKDIYPHIDWVLYTADGQLEHEFVVNEGGNVADIQVAYGGATSLTLNADGSLTATTPQGTITEHAPATYDNAGNKVASSFILKGNNLSYAVAPFAGRLVIDPALSWATYFGGTGNDNSFAVAAGPNAAYIAGCTASPSSIATSGAYQTVYGGDASMGIGDAFVARFDSSGSIQWATYIGGTASDYAEGIVPDAAGNVYVSGITSSTTGIATAGSYQPTMAGQDDAFLAKFSSSGALLWATYYGGPLSDEASTAAIDAAGYLYIAGQTNSQTGIATTGAWQGALAGTAGNSDAFLAKFSSAGALQWATYFGGPQQDPADGVTTDALNNVFITGITYSQTGIATAGAAQPAIGDTVAGDAYLAKFNSAGALQWATYYGGIGSDAGDYVASDPSGNVFITGSTTSTNNIATTGALQPAPGGSLDGYVAKFNTSGALQWGTYYGGSQFDAINAMAADGSGNIYLFGVSESATGIATPGSYQTTINGASDVFIAKLDGSGALQWGTYFGGNNVENAFDIAYRTGSLYLAGNTYSTAGFATTGAYQTIHGADAGGTDGYLVKFSACSAPVISPITGPSVVCVGAAINVADASGGGTWSVSNTHAGINASGLVTGLSLGVDTIKYTVASACGAAIASLPVAVGPNAGVISGPAAVCTGTTITLTAAVTGGTWTATNSTATVNAAGVVTGNTAGIDTIAYTVDNSCGPATATRQITIALPPAAGTVTGADTVCMGNIAVFDDTALSGTWSVANAFASISPSGVATGVSAGTDTVIYTVTNICGSATAWKALRVVDCNLLVSNVANPAGETRIYPNPTTGTVTIWTSKALHNVTISNLLGQTVQHHTELNNNVVIDLSALPAGIYMLRVNEDQVFKVIKE